MTKDLVLPVLVRTHPETHRSLFSLDHITAYSSTKYTSDSSGDSISTAYGFSHGAIVLGSNKPRFLLQGHSCAIVGVLYCVLEWGEQALLSIGSDGSVCCWGVVKGSCLCRFELGVHDSDVQSCCRGAKRKNGTSLVYVCWRNKPFIIAIDPSQDFKLRRLCYDLIHGVQHISAHTNAHGVNILKCVDNFDIEHWYDEDTFELLKSVKLEEFTATKVDFDLSEAQAFLHQPKGGEDRSVVVLGSVAVTMQNDELKIHGFPASAETKENSSMDSVLVDPQWDFRMNHVDVVDGLDGLLTERVIIARSKSKVSIWLVRISTQELKREPLVEEVLPWTTLTDSPIVDISFCPKLSTRQNQDSAQVCGLLCVLTHHSAVIVGVKRTLMLKSASECTSKNGCAVLHRIVLGVGAKGVEWGENWIRVGGTTWNLTSGTLERVSCAVNDEYHFKDGEDIPLQKAHNRHRWRKHLHMRQHKIHFPKIRHKRRSSEAEHHEVPRDAKDTGLSVSVLPHHDLLFTVKIKALLHHITTSLPSCLSLLMLWSHNSALDDRCKKVLGLSEPDWETACVVDTLRSAGMYVSLWKSEESVTAWGVSDKLSALHSLGLVSLFIGAMAKLQHDQNAQAVLSSLVTHYGIVYPEHFKKQKNYCQPSLGMIAKCALDPESHDVQVAARLLLQVSIERMSITERREAISQWSKRMSSEATMVLGAVGVAHPEDMAPEEAKLVARALVEHITEHRPHSISFAAELLAQGYHLWFPYIKDRQHLIQELLFHSESESTSEAHSLSVHSSCQRALIEIGSKQPLDFMQAIGREAIRPDVKSEHHRRALKSLAALIKKQPVVLVNHLPALVEVIIKTLDPSEAALRKACLKSSTMVLHSLVKRYPMVAFHQHTQRFAVGSSDNIIVIYDLRTATKWRILEGHSAPVSAICFEGNSGEQLASYSALEGSVRIWQTGSSGIFATILGIKGKCVQTHPLSPTTGEVPMITQLQTSSIKWEHHRIELVRESGEVVSLRA